MKEITTIKNEICYEDQEFFIDTTDAADKIEISIKISL